MSSEAFQAWIALFNDDFVQIYQKERKELQRVTLLSYAFQKELRSLRNKVEVEMINLKQLLKCKDDLEKQSMSLPPQTRKKSPVNKENDFESHGELKHTPTKKDQTEKKSPNLFKDIDLNAHCSSTDLSVIDLSISEDDMTKIDGSPTIKKRRRRYKVIPHPPAFSIISESEEKPVTPTNSVRDSVKANFCKTPVTKSDHNLSVIECTPEISTRKSKTSCRLGDFISKKKNKFRRGNNYTLTQMFKHSSMDKHKIPSGNKADDDDGVDSDETYFEGNATASKMDITELLDYVKKDDCKKRGGEKFTIQKENKEEDDSPEMETSNQEVDEFSKGAIFNEEDLDTSTEKPKVTHVEPEPVVRGKARKQLHGWACQQCRNFYEHQDLPPEEIQKKMDECSRHRYKYRIPEETIPGFWDLSIPPEKLE